MIKNEKMMIYDEFVCNSNMSYVLRDNSVFSSTGYKVLQNQKNDCFVKCCKMILNGRIQLYYIAEEYIQLSKLILSIDADIFISITSDLISHIMSVKSNGFLSCKNIDLSLEHIYVDPLTNHVRLIYLPLNVDLYSDMFQFERSLRTEICKAIKMSSSLNSPQTNKLLKNLNDETVPIENLICSFGGGKEAGNIYLNKFGEQNLVKQSMRLVAVNTPLPFELKVNRDEFTIGRKESQVDGLISFNKMIGRVHCKVNYIKGSYYITDLQSANGTYVNKVRITPNEPCRVENGDIVRLANSEFRVEIM